MRPNQSRQRRARLRYGIGLVGLLAALPYCATGSNLSVDNGNSTEASGGDTSAQGGEGLTPEPSSGGSNVTPIGGGPGQGGSPATGGAPETGGTATGGTGPVCTECPTGCVDLLSDTNNCGACDNVCGAGDACYSGVCSPACPGAGQQRCGGSCVDTTNSLYNCGQCGVECTGGKNCVSSACTCAAGQADCTGTCADLMTDSAHCGTCATDCAGATCIAGQCCQAPKAVCSGACVDTSSDVNHCGACDTPCTAGQTCSGSTCLTGTGGTGSGGTSGTGGGSTADGGGSGCLTDWRSSSCAATCLSQTQADRASCKDFLDCYFNNTCSPATCGSNDAVCGVNQLPKRVPSAGSAGKDIADPVYTCICG